MNTLGIPGSLPFGAPQQPGSSGPGEPSAPPDHARSGSGSACPGPRTAESRGPRRGSGLPAYRQALGAVASLRLKSAQLMKDFLEKTTLLPLVESNPGGGASSPYS